MRKGIRFLFFSKTIWYEPPRIRHQLAKLLADEGHYVEFFELPSYLWQSIIPSDASYKRINIYRYRQLIHHKLRVFSFFKNINAEYEKKQIKSICNAIDVNKNDVVVNFNYDYYFIREIFENNKIITIINDDFWSTAIGGYQNPLRMVLAKTVLNSDHVLTVSRPLANQLKEYCTPKLFYPWADKSYHQPRRDTKRSVLLFWGYVTGRLDYDYIRLLADAIYSRDYSYRIMIVGPIIQDCKKIRDLKSHPCVMLKDSMQLCDMQMDDVLCGFIPYKSGVPSIDVISLPNKTLQLLARGIPQLISGMPNFIKKPFVFRLSNDICIDLKKIQNIESEFSSLQKDIEEFVMENTAAVRYREFMNYVL